MLHFDNDYYMFNSPIGMDVMDGAPMCAILPATESEREHEDEGLQCSGGGTGCKPELIH